MRDRQAPLADAEKLCAADERGVRGQPSRAFKSRRQDHSADPGQNKHAARVEERRRQVTQLWASSTCFPRKGECQKALDSALGLQMRGIKPSIIPHHPMTMIIRALLKCCTGGFGSRVPYSHDLRCPPGGGGGEYDKSSCSIGAYISLLPFAHRYLSRAARLPMVNPTCLLRVSAHAAIIHHPRQQFPCK